MHASACLPAPFEYLTTWISLCRQVKPNSRARAGVELPFPTDITHSIRDMGDTQKGPDVRSKACMTRLGDKQRERVDWEPRKIPTWWTDFQPEIRSERSVRICQRFRISPHIDMLRKDRLMSNVGPLVAVMFVATSQARIESFLHHEPHRVPW